MIGWAVVIVFTFAFAAVLGGLVRTSFRPLDEIDEQCAAIDRELEARGL